MESNQIIETIGSITRMEHLKSIDHDILKNTFVLESLNPFPGYVSSGEPNKNPAQIYIILHYRYSPEKINRILKSLISDCIKCFPGYGEILTINSILPCVRIKRVDNYSIVPVIESFIKNNEIKLMQQKEFEGNGKVKIFKSFKLISISEGIYRDLHDGAKFYIRISKPLNWRRFEFIISRIKKKLTNNNFDAAPGVIYRYDGPEDVIRIYDPVKTLERALELKTVIHKEVKNEIFISSSHF